MTISGSPSTPLSGAPSAERTALVVVASTSAALGEADDRTGPVIVAWLREREFAVEDALVVADGDPVGQALVAGISQSLSLVVTTGGTGVSPTDATPEMTAPLLDRRLLGIEEELRRRGSAHVITALLSRGLVGVAGRTLIVNLPGSPGGVRDGLALLGELLDHLIDQLAGGGHDGRGASAAAYAAPAGGASGEVAPGGPAARETAFGEGGHVDHAVQSGRTEILIDSGVNERKSTDPSRDGRVERGGAGAAGQAAAAAARVFLARVTLDEVSVEHCSGLVQRPEAGAVVTFEGVVRDHDGGKGVAALEYEAHPSATDVIGEVAREVAHEHPEVVIAVEHRTGALTVGDVALACAISSAHRAEAFAACAALVDEVKARVPIWKKQDFTDGSAEWVASLG